MSTGRVPLATVVDALIAEGLVQTDRQDVASALDAMASVPPWYVRGMVGFGAWLASLLLIGFVAALGISFDAGMALFGAGFMTGAWWVRGRGQGDFAVQSALAFSLAGQALLVGGIMQLVDWDEPEVALWLVTVINVAWFVVFPDRIHRVICVLLAAGAIGLLCYVRELNAVVPLLGPAAATGVYLLQTGRTELFRGTRAVFVPPLTSGLLLSAFGYLSLSTVYLLPELTDSFEIYPRPWLSTILLGALFFAVLHANRVKLLRALPGWRAAGFHGLVAAAVAACWYAPGVVLAANVVVLGAGSGRRATTAAGIVFFAAFLAAYFYGIEITMLQKSITLVTTGVILLLVRYVLFGSTNRGAAVD